MIKVPLLTIGHSGFRASLAFTLRTTYLGDVLRRRSGLRHQPLHHHNLKDEAEKVNIIVQSQNGNFKISIPEEIKARTSHNQVEPFYACNFARALYMIDGNFGKPGPLSLVPQGRGGGSKIELFKRRSRRGSPSISRSPISVLASAIAEESEASPAFSDHVRMTDRVRVADGRRTVILQNWALTLKWGRRGRVSLRG